MTLVKGPNGVPFDIAQSVAAGLLAGRHVEKASREEYDAYWSPEDTPVPEDPPSVDPEEDQPPAAAPDESADESASADPPAPAVVEPASAGQAPAGNASRDDWAAHAVSLGFAEEQVEGLGREDIKKLIEQ